MDYIIVDRYAFHHKNGDGCLWAAAHANKGMWTRDIKKAYYYHAVVAATAIKQVRKLYKNINPNCFALWTEHEVLLGENSMDDKDHCPSW